jgi:outer membrane protein TolC
MALAASPELVAMREGGAGVPARVSRMSLLANPELRVVGASSLADELDPDDRRRINVGLRWTPPRIGELSDRTAMARAKAEEARDNLRAAENRIAAEVRLLHRTIRLIDEQIRIAEENVRLHEQIVSTVAAQVAAGLKTALDASRADLELAEIRSAATRRRAERELQMVRLTRMMGLPVSEPPLLEYEGDALAFRPPPANRVKLLEEALENRGELASAAARSRHAEAALAGVRRERYPWISYVQLTRQTTKVNLPGRWVFQVGVDLPVFRLRSTEQAAARAELRQAQLQGQAVRADIVGEVDEVLLRLQALARELTVHADEHERLAGRHAEIADAQLTSGASDRVEALTAGVRRLGARQTYVAKLMEYRALEIGLEQALGRAVSST